MKKNLGISVIALILLVSISSCTTLKGSAGGCMSTKGLVGYGVR